MQAYTRHQEAFSRGDASAYFDGFAETLDCFHAQQDLPRDGVREQRASLIPDPGPADRPGRAMGSVALRVVSESADEAELLDFGWTGFAVSRALTFHQRRIRLRRMGGRWLVVAEAAAGEPGCNLSPLRAELATPPALWTDLRDRSRDLVEACEGPPGSTMDDGYPGINGSNGCMISTNFPPTPEEYCDALEAGPDCLDATAAAMAAFFGREGPES